MFLSKVLILLGGLLAHVVAQSPTTSSPSAANTPSTSLYPLSQDAEFTFVLETFLAMAEGGGTNTGEILAAAKNLRPRDFESFYSSFYSLAESIHALGESMPAHQYPISVREQLFRASSYYRAADFFLHGNVSDDRIYTLWDKQLSDFNKANNLLPIPGVRKTITSGSGFDIPIIFWSPSRSIEKRPTVLVGTGYDGAQEDLFHFFGKPILDRGWNFVTYEGPGQPTVRRQQNIGFIPEWWKVISPIIDFLETRKDVDCSKIALQGVSFGGVLAPIAASREPRLAAMLAIDGVTSLWKTITDGFPPQLLQLYRTNRSSFDNFMAAAESNASYASNFRWAVDQGKFAWNTTSASAWLDSVQKFNLTPEAARNITCPVFISSGNNDQFFPGQPEELKTMLGDKAYLHEFTNEIGAGEHCQIGAEGQLSFVAYNWLQDVFDGRMRNEKTGNGTKARH